MRQNKSKGVTSRNATKNGNATAQANAGSGRATPKIMTKIAMNSPSKTEAAMNESRNASSIQNSSMNNSVMMSEKIPRARVAIAEFLGKAML